MTQVLAVIPARNKPTLLPIVVRPGARIGANAVILGGVTIWEDAIVGAGAVVTKDVPSGYTVLGNPASVVRL